ncbi:MAG: EAL domain-containing protein [Lachnospira sp.]|nr:EAL domain-containing protein [Lachnospira sp.]
MGGCYLGMAGHDVFNSKVKEIVSTGEHKVVLIALDISNFKYINDFYGMDEGDRVMQDIADFYFVNEPLCLASHGIGFDQFRGAYKVDGMSQKDVTDYIERKNEEFEAVLSARYPLVYQHVYVGLYFYDNPELDVRMAVDRANLAKKSTKGRFDIKCCVYSEDNCNEYLEHMDMSNEFVKACKDDRIEVYLQPKISVSENRIVGAEALVRMRSQDGNLISPAKFIPVLEDTGMIGKLDDIMLDKTFALQKECIRRGYKPVPVSVNISRQKFTSSDLFDYVIALQKKYDLDPSLVELEILETTFIDALEAMVNVIEELRRNGFRINVDDFGSGYSSLNQIASIPADIIKFDRVFASRSLKNDKGRKVIKSLIEMLRSVNYDLVFEGVETKEELDAVVSYGCDVIQGFYFDKPLPVSEFISKYYEGNSH